MKFLFLTLTIFTITQIVNAQKISGKITDQKDEPIPFANIDILKKETILKTVYSNFDGAFSIKLDSGTYVLKIQHASFESYEEKIKLFDSRSLKIKLKENETAHYEFNEIKTTSAIEIEDRYYEVPKVTRDGGTVGSTTITRSDLIEMPTRSADRVLSTTSGVSSTRPSEKSRSSDLYKGTVKKTTNGKAGILTAGEINDFIKWERWTDLTKDELKVHKDVWGVEVSGRYSVQLLNKRGAPIIDGEVTLVDQKDNEIYRAKTDNTGKAELWRSFLDKQSHDDLLSINVKYKKHSRKIKRAIPFKQGINYIVLDTDCNETKNVDIAFVVDATGSMGDEIEFLKAELNNVIFESKAQDEELNMRFANVFYRDHGDDYLTKTMNFSHILSESTTFIENQRANGGGDYEEAVEIALDTAINHLSWSNEAVSRILFLILDAPPHNNDKIKASLENSLRVAAAKGIRIIPLVASGINKNVEYLMRNIALATNGTYAFLTNHSGVGNNHIEPSTDSYEVELLKDLLIRVIKNYTFVPPCQDKKDEKEKDWTQIDSSKDQLKWKYWPNPTNGIIQIESKKLIEEFHVTDITGKLLLRKIQLKQKRTHQIDLRSYSNGIYIIKGRIGSEWITAKIILNRS